MKVPGMKNVDLPKDKGMLKTYAQELTKSLDKGQYKGKERERAIHILQTAKKEIKK